MPYKFNPIGPPFDIVEDVSSFGDVTGPASSTQYAVAIYADTTGKVIDEVSGLGSAGDVLTSNGAGVPPTWETPTPLYSFSAYLSADTGGVTGAGTAYTVLFDTELYDNGGVYTPGTGTFTAPVTGLYQLSFSVRMEGVTAAMTNGYLQLTAAGNTWRYGETNPGVGGTRAWCASQLVSMAATNTATVQIFLANGAGNTANVAGAATLITTFSGFSVR